MQHRPDAVALLTAVARFLEKEVKPALASDPKLSFRALIAASLAGIVAGEIQLEDAAEGAELERLANLLPDATLDEPVAPVTRAARRDSIEKLNAELCRRIRDGALEPDAYTRVVDHVKTTLQGELLIYSPRFDTSPEIE